MKKMTREEVRKAVGTSQIKNPEVYVELSGLGIGEGLVVPFSDWRGAPMQSPKLNQYFVPRGMRFSVRKAGGAWLVVRIRADAKPGKGPKWLWDHLSGS